MPMLPAIAMREVFFAGRGGMQKFGRKRCIISGEEINSVNLLTSSSLSTDVRYIILPL